MQVKIKRFDVDMEVKNNGIEFEVRSPDGSQHVGDCYLTRRGLIWCQGQTTRPNGVDAPWDEFITWMNNRQR